MGTIEPSVRLEVTQGADGAWDFVAYSGPPNPAPLVDYFDDTWTIAGYLWPAGNSPAATLPVVPTCAWTDSAAGEWTASLTPADTAALAPGYYRFSGRATKDASVKDLAEVELVVLPGPGAGAAAGPSPVAVPTAAGLALTPVLYCTDEDLARRAGADFTSLLLESQVLARGNDGVFDEADPWTLTSDGNDFGAQLPAVGSTSGAAAAADALGYVGWLRKPASYFPAGGVLMAVAAVSGHAITLRRLGMAVNQGMAPAPAAGLSGVEFQVVTFYPQIEDASYGLNQLYTIDAMLPGRAPASMADIRPLRKACVAMVLLDRYGDEARAGRDGNAEKVILYKQELSDLKAVLKLRWDVGFEDAPTTTLFSTRIVR